MTIDTRLEINGVIYNQDIDPRDGSAIETDEHFQEVKNFMIEMINDELNRPEKPYPNWIWDSINSEWICPKPKPEVGNYAWNDELIKWESEE